MSSSKRKENGPFEDSGRGEASVSGHKFFSVEDEILKNSDEEEEEALVKVFQPIEDDDQAKLQLERQIEEVTVIQFCILFSLLFYLFHNVMNYC